MDEWITVRSLRRNGLSIKQIARQLNLARNSVRKYLRQDSPPQRTTAAALSPQLDAFAADVTDMLNKRFGGAHILQELRKKGYSQPARSFYRHLAALKVNLTPPVPCIRFETPPGDQAQFDWATYAIPFASSIAQVHIFSLILGYSRYQHFYPSLDCTQATIFDALEHCFHALRGVPKEILFDNPKAIATRPRPDLRWNRSFLAFAGHY